MKIALTMGDPAGIGPEITRKALVSITPWLAEQQASITYFGDPKLLGEQAALCDHALIPCASTPTPGQGDPVNAAATIQSIEQAVEACQQGNHHAVVTNPINKAVLYTHGFNFPGHTEFLGHLCACDAPTVMMLSSIEMNVVPITLHVSLADAIAQIRKNGPALIRHAVETTAQAFHNQGINHPRLAISGLNPHAGEQGAMGMEEMEIIAPTIQCFADRKDMTVTGPWPADTMFDAHNRQRYDAALAMTHDQALIPIKTLAFDTAVNVTLGLPIIRTSPDHGTAYDIAGKDIARPDSLIAAIKKAVDMAKATAQ